jgi:uncharacterized protein YjbJ (UPF0337 family)
VSRDVCARDVAGHNAKDRSIPEQNKETLMGNLDEAKGRAKQAVGDLTDNDDLRREGKVDEKAGQVKDKVGDAVDKVKDKVTGK